MPAGGLWLWKMGRVGESSDGCGTLRGRLGYGTDGRDLEDLQVPQRVGIERLTWSSLREELPFEEAITAKMDASGDDSSLNVVNQD